MCDLFMILLVAFLGLLSLVSAQDLCGQDLSCLAALSQYVVLGTVLTNTLGMEGSTTRNYNATISVKCAFLSFSSPPDAGDNLAGQIINVSKFGGGSSCPHGFVNADINSTQIFFIHVR